MKMNKLVFPLVIALAATLASTGCKKGTPKTTIIPGPRVGQVSDTELNNTLRDANKINPDENAMGNKGPINTAERDLFEGMIKDPAALAAYTVHFAFDSATVKKGEE